ncbi:porphobilinogen deaminase [Aureococcus anophagefferens]|nr:porphobilinogen deaminase [Aureococcus anophagefferens]
MIAALVVLAAGASALEATPLRIGTRGSPLALAQVREIGGKGLFTKELDVALLGDEVDICVHSMKDVPTWLPAKTVLPCMLEREDTRDVFISPTAKSLKDLKDGSVIGSASLRRQSQILAINPTLKAPSASSAAAAPAALKYIAALNHEETFTCVSCERAFLAALDGNCKTPIAGQARIVDGELLFDGLVSSLDGQQMYRATKTGSPADAEKIGREAGEGIKAEAGIDGGGSTRRSRQRRQRQLASLPRPSPPP